MSKLKEQIQNDIKTAMKTKDKFKRDSLRLLSSAMKQIEVDERKTLSDEDIMKIIQKMLKQRDDSATQFKDAGREDLYEQEINEANLLKEYLPQQLSDSELKERIQSIITKVGAISMKDMGKIMGVASKELQGIADGKRISLSVKSILG